MFKRKIKSIFSKTAALLALSLIFFSMTMSLVSAQDATVGNNTPKNPGTGGDAGSVGGISSIIRQVGDQTKLPSYDAGHANQNYASGASQLTSIIYFLLDFLKYILGGVAVIMIIISGTKLIMSARTVSDAMNKEKENIRFALTGLILIVLANQIVPLFFGQEGEIFRTGTDMQIGADGASNFVSGLTGLLRIFIPSLAVLFMVIAGVRLLASQGEPEKMNKAKTQVTWAVIGLIVAGLAEVVVFQIIFPNQGSTLPDTQAFAKTIVTMTNFLTGFISTIAVTMIIYAGYLYVVSLGGEGVAKAKKILVGAVVGLLISMAAYGLVNTFVKLEPPSTIPTTQSTVPNP